VTTSVLAQAHDLLARAGPEEPHAVRAACWVARSALEDELRSLLARAGADVNGASTRSALVVLRVVAKDDPELMLRAEYAWARLSDASHHHAYELAPTLAEVRALVETVEWIAAR
jgi:hypothetical protein